MRTVTNKFRFWESSVSAHVLVNPIRRPRLRPKTFVKLTTKKGKKTRKTKKTETLPAAAHPSGSSISRRKRISRNNSSLENSLESLIETAKSHVGRSELASKNVLPAVLEIVKHQYHHNHVISLCFKLLRNLFAGELSNQNSFLEHNGVAVVSDILRSEAADCSNSSLGSDHGLVRWGLQVLANVCLAGRDHQRAVWGELFPEGFVVLARVGNKEICDPLCMVIFACCDGNPEWFRMLSSDGGWPLMVGILKTASSAGFG
ncbi:hypothetical protein PIB30_027452 [Stylosanthes scabra]|uniref:Uncharacterized protein n=1 Tax=Stylosanthes scabra TaxID=79078 RepID=A0ABU6YAY8_9FABA|nr:hypothetical protein [Stylosanthes scabra]